MYTFLLVIDVLASVGLIGLVLIQHGKGADAGAAFGSGASGTVFGARGSANFLTHTTAACAAVFFLSSLALAYLVQGRRVSESVVETVGAQRNAPAPAAPAPLVPGATPPAATPAPTPVPVIPENAAPPAAKPADHKPAETPKVPQ